MIKRLISIGIVGILVFSIFGCAETAEDTLIARTDSEDTENTSEEDAETAISAEEYGQMEEGIASPESVDDQGETDAESSDITPMPNEIEAIEKEQRQIKKVLPFRHAIYTRETNKNHILRMPRREWEVIGADIMIYRLSLGRAGMRFKQKSIYPARVELPIA